MMKYAIYFILKLIILLYKTLTIDLGICSNFIFLEKVWEYFLHHILYMVFQEKCFFKHATCKVNPKI